MKAKLPLRVKASIAILVAMFVSMVIAAPAFGAFVIGFALFMYATITLLKYLFDPPIDKD